VNEYDAVFNTAIGANQASGADPYDAIFANLAPKQAAAKGAQDTKIKPDVPGVGETLLIGAGRTFDRLGAGLQQAYYGARGDKDALARLEADQADKSRIFAGLQAERPIATAVGQALPAMAVPIGGAGAGVGSLAARAAVAGATPEALSYGSAEDRLKNAAFAGAGGAAGAGLGYGLGKAVNAVGGGLRVNPQAQSAASVLEKSGIPIRPDQATGNRTLQNLNAALDNLPITAGRQQAFREGQQEAFNRAVGKFIGQDASSLDDAARASARDSLSRGYTEVAARNTIPAPRMTQALDEISTAAQESFSPRVQGWANNVLDRIGKDGALPGRAYKDLDSKLGAAMKGGGPDSHYIGQIRQALRNAMSDSVRPEDAGKWADLDKAYSALGAISKSVDESGNVSARKLFTNTRDKSVARLSRGEIGELAKAARTVLPDQIANSGTAQRMAAQALLTGGGGLTGYVAGGGNLENAAYGAGGALALPLLARSAINNPQLASLLSRQFFQVPGAAPIGGLLGAGAGLSAPSLLFPAAAQ
jgi:hypothetical protein